MAIERNTQPTLGYGKPSEASIDQVNIWMRSTPWYQQQLRAWGQDPGHPNLSKDQSRQILQHAQANGVVVDEGDMEIDNHGNFNPKGHKLRNTLIVAGIAGATLATMGAAGAFSGAAAGGGAAGASGASAIPALEGGATLAANLGAASALPAIGAGTAAGAGAAGTAAAAGGSSVAGKVKNAVTGGTGKDFLKDLALLGGGNFLSGLGDSLFQQKRNSFSGTAADPVHVVSGVQRRIEDAAGPLHDRAFGPVSTPNAYAQPVKGLTGVDPAFADRSLLTNSGSGQSDDLAHLQQVFSLLGWRK